jgi:hypothetical protein
MVELSLEVKGLEELTRALAALPSLVQAEMTAAMNEAVHVVEGEVKERTPVGAAGRGSFSQFLAQTITTDVTADAAGVTGEVGTDVAYAPYVEEGTAPHWPPFQPLYEWVAYSHKFGVYSIRSRRRLGGRAQIEAENRAITRRIQAAIARRGTKGAYMFRDGLAASAETVQDVFDRAIERVIGEFDRR